MWPIWKRLRGITVKSFINCLHKQIYRIWRSILFSMFSIASQDKCRDLIVGWGSLFWEGEEDPLPKHGRGSRLPPLHILLRGQMNKKKWKTSISFQVTGCPQEALCFHINLTSHCSSDPRNVNVFKFPGRPLITKNTQSFAWIPPSFPLSRDVEQDTQRSLMSEKHSSCASYSATIIISVILSWDRSSQRTWMAVMLFGEGGCFHTHERFIYSEDSHHCLQCFMSCYGSYLSHLYCLLDCLHGGLNISAWSINPIWQCKGLGDSVLAVVITYNTPC